MAEEPVDGPLCPGHPAPVPRPRLLACRPVCCPIDQVTPQNGGRWVGGGVVVVVVCVCVYVVVVGCVCVGGGGACNLTRLPRPTPTGLVFLFFLAFPPVSCPRRPGAPPKPSAPHARAWLQAVVGERGAVASVAL